MFDAIAKTARNRIGHGTAKFLNLFMTETLQRSSRYRSVEEVVREINGMGIGGRIQRYPVQYDINEMLQYVKAFGDYHTGNFKLTENNKFLYVNLIKWLMGDSSCQCLSPSTRDRLIPADLSAGIYIGGKTGTGKTVATRILCDLARMVQPPYFFNGKSNTICWRDLRADEIVESFSHGKYDSTLNTVAFLSIQDLGSEPNEAMDMGNRQNVIKQLLEKRADNGAATIITSNYPLCSNAIVQLYGDRIQSRLMSSCNYFELHGDDYRKR